MTEQTSINMDSTNDAATEREGHTPVHPRVDRISRLAYQFYEERGRQDGYDLEDWLVAERAVSEE